MPAMVLAVVEYVPVVVLVLAVVALSAAIMVATHVIGPRRRGTIKESTYESGVDPIGDARRRFNVRFYIVAMLFLLFHVEIVFFYPWATLFPRLRSAEYADWAATMTAAGFGPGFFLLEMALFMAILLVGYVYAWRRGVFRWD